MDIQQQTSDRISQVSDTNVRDSLLMKAVSQSGACLSKLAEKLGNLQFRCYNLNE